MKTRFFPACLALLLAGPAAAADAVWITNVRLVSPERMDIVERGSVLVRDGLIASVERGSATVTPQGARRIDGKGYYLTPGLIDSHVHLLAVPGMTLDQAAADTPLTRDYFRQLPRSYLYHGFTTVVDLALSNPAVLARFNREPLRPGVIHCGEPLVLANGYPMSFIAPDKRFKMFGNFIHDPAQGAAIPPQFRPEEHTPAAGVARIAAQGGKCVKTHFERGFGGQRNLPVMSPAVFAQVRAAATENALVLVTHANSLEAQSFAVDGNADVLAHGMWHWGSQNASRQLPAEIKALLDKIAARGTGVQPTMQVLYGLRAYFEPGYLSDPAVRKVVPAALAAWFASPAGRAFREEIAEGGSDAEVLAGFDGALRRQRQVVAYLADKDANLLLGSDTPSSPTYGNLPGLNGYREIRRMHEAGMSLRQVFKAATINNARAFGLDRSVGTIEAGKAANLLLMKTSPLEDIAAYDKIVTVWIDGKSVARPALAADSPER
ncbi:MAG: amidohydrolase family protein [Telluria sp.]